MGAADLIRAIRHVAPFSVAALAVGLSGAAVADEQVRTTTAELVRSPAAYEGKPVALTGCQLGQLPDGPACWVLVKGRNVGVIRL